MCSIFIMHLHSWTWNEFGVCSTVGRNLQYKGWFFTGPDIIKVIELLLLSCKNYIKEAIITFFLFINLSLFCFWIKKINMNNIKQLAKRLDIEHWRTSVVSSCFQRQYRLRSKFVGLWLVLRIHSYIDQGTFILCIKLYWRLDTN